MRITTLACMAAFVALAACGNPAKSQNDQGRSPSGAYKVTMMDGTAVDVDLKADGSFTMSESGGPVAREGTWRRADGQFCLNDTARPREVCMDEAPVGDNGGFDLSGRGKVVMQFRPMPAASS